MRAMVLAAGLGTRLRPLTRLAAKPVLPVLNRPLLHWTLLRLAACGVREVMINLHHRSGSVVRAIGDGRALGLRVSYSAERTILGTGGGPRRVRDFFGNEPFVLVNGDVYFDFDLRRLLAAHRATGARVTLALRPLPPGARYGAVISGRDGRIRSLAGLPAPSRGTASLFAGIHVLDPHLLERLPPGRSDSVRDLYVPMLAHGEAVHGLRMSGRWYDFGAPSLYLASQLALVGRRSLVDPAAHIDPKARVVRSVVGAGTRVAAGAVLRDSVLWGGVRIGAHASVTRSIVTAGRLRAGESVEDMVVMARERHEIAS